jgi:hypothetical protein
MHLSGSAEATALLIIHVTSLIFYEILRKPQRETALDQTIKGGIKDLAGIVMPCPNPTGLQAESSPLCVAASPNPLPRATRADGANRVDATPSEL